MGLTNYEMNRKIHNVKYLGIGFVCWLWQSWSVKASSIGQVKQVIKAPLTDSRQSNQQEQAKEQHKTFEQGDAKTPNKGLSSKPTLSKKQAQIHVLQKQSGALLSVNKDSKLNLDQQLEEINQQLVKFEKIIQIEKMRAQLLQEQNNRLQAEIDLIQAKIKRDKYIYQQPVYLKKPLRTADNILVISDRCIHLNGEIVPWKADWIVDRTAFFNRKNSQYPIFLVIGSSPGGFVLPGIRILQAIKYSKAPVYVVLKDFAASMAAILVTLSPNSYACTGSVMLHHQCWLWSFSRMNVTDLKQWYQYLGKRWKNIGGAIAKKMGISLQNFEKKLAEKGGEWREYSDDAKKLKWVNHIINGIEDTAIFTLPEMEQYNNAKALGQLNHYESINPIGDQALLGDIDYNYSIKNSTKAHRREKL